MPAAALKLSDGAQSGVKKVTRSVRSVTTQARTRKKPAARSTIYIGCALSLVCTMIVILALNIQISSSQYHLVELSARKQTVTQEIQALSQELEFANAPQNLAKRAANLGMVPSKEFGTVDLRSDTTVGDPQPAEKANGEDQVLIDTAHGAPEVEHKKFEEKAPPKVVETDKKVDLVAPRQRTPGVQE